MDKTYSELLRDPRWQKRKTEIMQRDNFTCQECGCKTKTLNVHHLHYLPNRNPWDYPDEDLTTLCEDCHNKIHNKIVPKVGNVYSKNHSEYTDYMICYGVNYSRNVVYLLGMDTGAGEYTIYFESIELDSFKERYSNSHDVLDDILDEDRGYIGHVLAYMLANIYEYGSHRRNDYSYECLGFDYSDEKVIEYAKQNVMRVVSANDNLLNVFRDIIC